MTPQPKGTPIVGIVAHASGHVTKAADRKDRKDKK
jgi:hypothetical protein